MKKLRFLKFCAFFMVLFALSSCLGNEGNIHGRHDGISFKVENSPFYDEPGTKSSAIEDKYIALICKETGDTLDVQLSISGKEVQTKGSIVSSSNIESLYGSIAVRAFVNDEDTPYFDTVIEKLSSDSGLWGPEDRLLWPKVGSSIDFWAWAPILEDIEDKGSMTDPDIDAEHDVMTFNYSMQSPDGTNLRDAENQMDLVLGFYSIPSVSDNQEPALLTLRHALSAIRFKTGKLEEGTIKSVSLVGIKSSGTCSFSPRNSSRISWTADASSEATFTQIINKEFAENHDSSSDSSQEITNDYDGSLFIVIPQDASDCKMRVVFEHNGVESTYEADLAIDLEPGIIYTYRISILDGLTVEAGSSIVADGEEDLTIKNTGKVSEYVRAAIVGNWVNAEGEIIAPWSGVLNDSEGPFYLDSSWSSYWIYDSAEDIYYYLYPISPGDYTAVKLFENFTLPASAPVDGARLKFSVFVQSVPYESTKLSAAQAWGSAAAANLLTE